LPVLSPSAALAFLTTLSMRRFERVAAGVALDPLDHLERACLRVLVIVQTTSEPSVTGTSASEVPLPTLTTAPAPLPALHSITEV
jgi:hypothetical protein